MAAAEAIARATLPRSLLELRLGGRRREEGTLQIPGGFPTLERLDAKCRTIAFGDVLELPRARALSLDAYQLGSLPRLVAPELVELGLRLGTTRNSAYIVTFAEQAPRLRVLRLRGVSALRLGTSIEWTDPLRELLASSLLEQLRELDLRGNAYQPDVELLLDNADRLRHLERLDLRMRRMPGSLEEQLARVFPNAILGRDTELEDDAYEAYEHDEDEDGDEYWEDEDPALIANEDEPPEEEEEPADEDADEEPTGVDDGAPPEERTPDDDLPDY